MNNRVPGAGAFFTAVQVCRLPITRRGPVKSSRSLRLTLRPEGPVSQVGGLPRWDCVGYNISQNVLFACLLSNLAQFFWPEADNHEALIACFAVCNWSRCCCRDGLDGRGRRCEAD